VQEDDEAPIDLKPTGLSISDEELDFLGQLGALLSSSPRTIKRFVNTYRLISVAMAQADLHESELRPRDTEIRMLLLAIFVGMPDLSRWLQTALGDLRGTNPALTPLVKVMDELAGDASIAETEVRAIGQWSIVRQWIEQRGEPWTTMSTARVTEWLEPVGRYTFNLTRATMPRTVFVPTV
jgi:hypothetical protein